MSVKRGTIREERPDLLKYLVNEEDGELTCGSGKKIEVKCLICNKINEMYVYNLDMRGFYCKEESCALSKSNKTANSLLQDYKLKVGQVINDMEVLECIRVGDRDTKAYRLKCKKDNTINIIKEYDLVEKGHNCPVCSNRKIIKGINDISTTNPELIKYFKNTNDCFKYSRYSNKKVMTICPDCKSERLMYIHKITEDYTCSNKLCSNYEFKKSYNTRQDNKIKYNNYLEITHPHLLEFLKYDEDKFKSKGSRDKIKVICPNCKTEKEIRVANLVNQGFSCQTCGDGVSYPNKFIECLLRQLKVEILREKRFDWSKIDNTYKIYDVYIPNLNCIIENHGGQHYEKSGIGRSLKEEQESDKLKKELALKNNIKHYIVIDCRKSEMQFIKKSVMSSDLPKLLNFKKEDINWKLCHKYACNSKIFEACNLWNNGYSTKQIADELLISPDSARIYLKQGLILNLCDYDTTESMMRGNIEHNYYNARKIYIDKRIFKSISKANKYYNVTHIGHWLDGTRKMPQEYIDLGLRYATEEDLNTYEFYKN